MGKAKSYYANVTQAQALEEAIRLNDVSAILQGLRDIDRMEKELIMIRRDVRSCESALDDMREKRDSAVETCNKLNKTIRVIRASNRQLAYELRISQSNERSLRQALADAQENTGDDDDDTGDDDDDINENDEHDVITGIVVKAHEQREYDDTDDDIEFTRQDDVVIRERMHSA